MENSDNLKITFAKNLTNINLNTTISIPIDANVNIKTILDINSYLYDESVECGNGKAIINGKIGIKVVYIDTDNITNTISNSQSFSETFLDNAITSDCYINVMHSSMSNNILSSDGILKINCDISISPIMYVNIGTHSNITNLDNMILKKSEITTTSISNVIDKRIDYTTNFETKDNISKILEHNAYFTQSNIVAQNGMAIIEGKLYSTLLFETIRNDEPKVLELKDCFNVKFNIELEDLSMDSELDLSVRVDPANESISTETEDDNNIIIVTNKLRIAGVAIKYITIDIVDDAFSTDYDVDLNITSRDYFKLSNKEYIKETISNEISLSNDENAIEELISNLNIVPEITNRYLKDNILYLEGIITSHLVYIDENMDKRQKICEIPFIINTKISMTELNCIHTDINVEDCKCKVKRGTIIELEYLLDISICSYIKESKEQVDNISLGKNLDFSQYDYQIYLAKPNETLWELCKRIKITPDNLKLCNPNLPDIMLGGEKVIIKR
ncbi:MAG: DUF3794 domain-containing protein [Clostridia bacterium]